MWYFEKKKTSPGDTLASDQIPFFSTAMSGYYGPFLQKFPPSNFWYSYRESLSGSFNNQHSAHLPSVRLKKPLKCLMVSVMTVGMKKCCKINLKKDLYLLVLPWVEPLNTLKGFVAVVTTCASVYCCSATFWWLDTIDWDEQLIIDIKSEGGQFPIKIPNTTIKT